jgi:hypothetical protein
MAWPAAKFQDGDLSVAKPVNGLPEFEAPLPGVATEVLLTQKWQMNRNAYDAAGPLPLNTPHPIYPAFVLAEEGPRRGIGGPVVEFVRTYAKVPPSHFDWPDFTYTFVGTTIAIGNPATFITRDPKAWKVKSQVRYDYFLVPSVGIVDPITGDVVNINSPGDIQQILDMQYVIQNTINGQLLGGIILATNTLNVAGAVIPTYPTSDQYNAQMADALANGWNSTISKIVLFPTNTLVPGGGHMAGTVDTANSLLGGIIPAEPSSLTRWKGNIYQRATRYVLAK